MIAITTAITLAAPDPQEAASEPTDGYVLMPKSPSEAILQLDGWPRMEWARYQAMIAMAQSLQPTISDCGAPSWISVNERMPDEGQRVIVLFWPYDNHENAQIADEAQHIEGTFYTSEGDDHHFPSHWMPFPELPGGAA